MRKSLFVAGLSALAVMFGSTQALAADTKVSARTGVLVTPKNFPNQSADDVADMFRLGAEIGSYAVMRVNWSDAKRWDAAQVMAGMAEKRGLATVIELAALKADEIKGASLDPPKDVSEAAGKRLSFGNPAVAERFTKAVLELAELKPDYLGVAVDVNLLQQSDAAEYAAFAEVYKALYPKIKQRSPQTKVYASFQWDALQQQGSAAARKTVGALRPRLDLAAFNSEPRRLHEKAGPGGVPANYFARIAEFSGGGEPVALAVTWPSEGKSGEAEQLEFIRALPRLTSALKPAMLTWTLLHDVKVLVFFTARLGLLDHEGKAKPGFAAFRALSNDRPAVASTAAGAAAAPARMPRSAAGTASREPAQFAVYTARRDGSELKILISDPEREMSHPRVSPDRSRIVLTRYTKRGRDGKASEEQGYEGTEILVMNLDGSGLETIVPAKPGVVAANGCWTPDGKSLIFISTDNPKRSPEIRQIDLATREVTRVPTPPGLQATDPHWEAGQIVFPVKSEDGKGADALWIMNADGSSARQITRPPRSKSSPGLYGDFDPKISPDGKKVAFMRIDGGDAWKVMVLDLASGTETLLSPKGPMQWLPTWSSDGQALLYVHVDRDNPKQIGLYTMTVDGKDRRMIPLPRGYLYGHSTFFPGDGSSDQARIIFNGTPKPGL